MGAGVADLLARIDDVVAERADGEHLRAWLRAHRREVAAGDEPGARWLCDAVTERLAATIGRRDGPSLARAALRRVAEVHRARWR